MAHIPDGVLSVPVLIGGAAVAAAGVALGLRALDEARLPRAAMLSAAFFALSLVMIPLGATSVHLLLSTLMGLTIGLATYPAVLVGLLLQAMMFGVGGLTTLGVNVAIVATPGVLAGLAARGVVARAAPATAALVAGAAAAAAVALTTALVAGALALSDPAYRGAAALIGLANLPLMAVEALATGFAVGFLRRVRPETLAARHA